LVEELVQRLIRLQSKGEGDIPKGNFTSRRYHPYFPISREEDNVFFVSWIVQLLKRLSPELSDTGQAIYEHIIKEGEAVIGLYRNRYGEDTYNFYRPKHWFPNGRLLSKHVRFQPTDDIDDTAIALRGATHSKAYAQGIKERFIYHSNGQRGRWSRRGPKRYRHLHAYATWIGSESMLIDLDLVVMCNALIFSAQYELNRSQQDEESLSYIMQCIDTKDAWDRPWAVSNWYPSAAVILYSLSDLMESGAYPELDKYRPDLMERCEEQLNQVTGNNNKVGRPGDMYDLLAATALYRLSGKKQIHPSMIGYQARESEMRSFSFGVIPLTHPWNGLFAQWLGGKDLFRMKYECEAQCAALELEWACICNQTEHNTAVVEINQAFLPLAKDGIMS